MKNLKSPKEREHEIKRRYLCVSLAVSLCWLMAVPALADGDPLATINNLSTFVFSAIKAIGVIMLGFGIVQIGLSLKSHDASQRANGFMTFFGGVVIAFAKEILDTILS
ncbi:TrbC/VirB2 family protein [Anaerotruncus rubiinfantis]|uniref:TrbC/VirB2 family protein n=1 Tax=Anaerotruncus rubiinfantis TaxID=1720200 RepID=UPI0034A443B3